MLLYLYVYYIYGFKKENMLGFNFQRNILPISNINYKSNLFLNSFRSLSFRTKAATECGERHWGYPSESRDHHDGSQAGDKWLAVLSTPARSSGQQTYRRDPSNARGGEFGYIGEPWAAIGLLQQQQRGDQVPAYVQQGFGRRALCTGGVVGTGRCDCSVAAEWKTVGRTVDQAIPFNTSNRQAGGKEQRGCAEGDWGGNVAGEGGTQSHLRGNRPNDWHAFQG